MSAIRQEMAELLAPMNPEIFEFEDESHLHAGHAGNRGGGHYSVLVVSEVFAGQPRIALWRRCFRRAKSTRSPFRRTLRPNISIHTKYKEVL